MGITRKIWLILSRTFLLVLGVLLLATAIPHKDPWNMSRIGINYDAGSVAINPPIIKFPINTSIRNVFMVAGVILLALVIITSSGRRAAFNCFRKFSSAFAFLLSAGLLIFTLYPTKSGMPIVMYLTFGFVGLLFSFMAVYPPAVWIGRFRAGVVIRQIMGSISSFIYSVNIKYLLGAVFIVVFTLTNLGSYFIFEHIPHIQDSLDQVFHGKIFSIGRLTVPSHKYKEFFDFTHMINDGKWYSEYPPAHSFLMMLGIFLNMPWIINPLMGSLAILTFYFIGKEIYDEKTGRIALLLGLFSPFIIFMSSEFMSHGSALFFISLFILFFARTVNRAGIFNPFVSGVSLGMALNGRPMTAFAVSVPFAIYAFIILIRKSRKYVIRLSIMLFTVAVFVGIMLLFNYLTTGDPLLFGYEAKWGAKHNPGFGHSAWGEPHSPSKGLRQNLNNLNALNKYLFEWPIPCLLFVSILFASVTKEKWDYLLVCSFWSLSIAYFFYWFQDWCFGPRFMYESSVMAILLTARGILRTPKLINKVFGLKTHPDRIKSAVGAVVIVCILIGLTFHIRPLIRLYSNSYWGVNASALKAVKRAGITNAVVFTKSYYGSVLPANSPLFDGDIIYVRDLGEKNKFMMDYYPDRRYYGVNGSSIFEIFSPLEGEIVLEAESMKIADSSGDRAVPQKMSGYGPYWSGNSQILANTDAVGDYLKLEAEIEAAGVYEITLHLTKANDYGKLKFLVNGEMLGDIYDGYNSQVIPSGRLNMGKTYLKEGKNHFRIEVAGKNKASKNYFFGVDCFAIRRTGGTN